MQLLKADICVDMHVLVQLVDKLLTPQGESGCRDRFLFILQVT